MKLSNAKAENEKEVAIVELMRKLMELEMFQDKQLTLWVKREYFPGFGGIGIYIERELFLTEYKYKSRLERFARWITWRSWPFIARTRCIYGTVESIEFQDAAIAEAADEIIIQMRQTHPQLEKIETVLA